MKWSVVIYNDCKLFLRFTFDDENQKVIDVNDCDIYFDNQNILLISGKYNLNLNFELQEDGYYRNGTNFIVSQKTLRYNHIHKSKEEMRRVIQPRQKGVGSYLTSWFSSLGIKAHVGCKCKSLAAEMDRKGVDYVDEHFNEYVDKLYDSAKSWRKGREFFPQPPRFVLKYILSWAIKSARQQKGLQLEIPEVDPDSIAS